MNVASASPTPTSKPERPPPQAAAPRPHSFRFASILALGGSPPSLANALAFSEAGVFGRGAPTAAEFVSLPPQTNSSSSRPPRLAPNVAPTAPAGASASLGRAGFAPAGTTDAQPLRQPYRQPLCPRAHADAPQSTTASSLAEASRSVDCFSRTFAPARVRPAQRAPLQTAAHTNAVNVAFYETGRAAEVIARVGRMTPTERARLRQAVANLLARHGYHGAHLRLSD